MLYSNLSEKNGEIALTYCKLDLVLILKVKLILPFQLTPLNIIKDYY